MIKKKVYFSESLNMHYRHCTGGIIFEDKVIYTDEELEIIKDSSIDIETIHTTKKFFDGRFISAEDLKKLNQKYVDEESPFIAARKYASKLIGEGLKGRDAVHKAASKYNVSAIAIGKELGKRKGK